MKQQIVLIGLVFAMLTAYSQNDNSATATTTTVVDTAKKVKDYCPHRIWVDFGMAWSNNVYNRVDNIQQKYAFGNVLEAGYSYFFHPKMGVGLGVGISKLSAKALLGNGGSIFVYDENYVPGAEDGSYEMFFLCDKFAEKQNIWAIEVPLTFQFEHKMGASQRNGIFASLGVKGYFPISSRTNFTGGDLAFSGYDPYLNCVWPKDMDVHFEPAHMGENYAKTKLRSSIDLIADFGGLFYLTKHTDFYLGIYGSYGFLDLLPKSEKKVTYIQKDGSNAPTVEGMLNSNALEAYNLAYPDNTISEKWNLVNAGVKVGFRFKPCGQNSRSLREAKRDFLDNYEDRLNNAAGKSPAEDDGGAGKKGKKGGESIYIIPVYIGGGNDGGNGSGGGNKGTSGLYDADDLNMDKDVRDLMDAFSKAQIYFPLDKDVPINPKLANQEVDRAVSILKRRPDLKVILGGYTCKLGTHQHNADLAQRRANRIMGMIKDKGIDSKQIETQAFTAEDYPAGLFSTLEEARTVIVKIEQLNR